MSTVVHLPERAAANAPSLSTAGSTDTPAASDLQRLVETGFGPFVRPVAPPGTTVLFKVGPKPSDGKVPALYGSEGWVGFSGWPAYQPAAEDFARWAGWPAPNFCVVTGAVGAVDVDIKFGNEDTSAEAVRGRKLIAAIKEIVARATGVRAADAAARWRTNSSSTALFLRLADVMSKRRLELVDRETGELHAVELLATGQQLAVAGVHRSGVSLQSNLADVGFDGLPRVDAAGIDAIFAAITDAAKGCGFDIVAKAAAGGKTAPSGPLSPARAVEHEVWRRRADWAAALLPASVATPTAGEWTASSDDLERDLDERLAIYGNGSGAYDFGAERPHGPVSLIREFGAMDAAGDISFGGSPEYGALDGQPYAVVGEPDPSIRRPTEPEAIRWLCRQLAGQEFPAFADDATWRSALPTIAASVGLDWAALQHVDILKWFTPDVWPSHLTKLGVHQHEVAFPAAYVLSADEVLANLMMFPALRAMAPDEANKVEIVLEMRGALPRGFDALIAVERQRTVEAAVAGRAPSLDDPSLDSASPADADRWTEPLDLFGDEDPGELATPPSGSLPASIERWVATEARRKGVPQVFAAMPAITVIGSAIGTSLRIQVRRFDTGWLEPAAFWTVLVADPGRGKSPIMGAASKPLREIDHKKRKADEVKVAAWTERSKAKRKPGDAAPLIGPQPPVRRHMVDDVTTEKLIEIMADNPRGVLRPTDEYAALHGSHGAYKNGPAADRGRMLSMFDGSAVSVDRKGSGHVSADSALLSILSGTQPEKLRALVADLGADGMLQRTIFIMHDGREHRGIDEVPDDEAIGRYAGIVQALANAEYPPCSPIRLTDEAYGALEEASLQISKLGSCLGSTPAFAGHVEKWGRLLPRLVLIIHAVERVELHGSVDPSELVELATVKRAVRFARFLLRHSLAFYREFLGRPSSTTEALWFADFLLTHPQTQIVKHRDIGQAKSRLRGDDMLRQRLALMAELENAGWAAVSGWSQGVPQEWTINPRIHARFAERTARVAIERAEKQAAIKASGRAEDWVQGEDNDDE
ncbi:MAG TPA: DUF3987 domain-containing protein [Xanthobacteraceae bacterium]|nr:DUF3987 domain-containing protein [Xanthobacteraceae bacterium]